LIGIALISLVQLEHFGPILLTFFDSAAVIFALLIALTDISYCTFRFKISFYLFMWFC